MRILSPSYRLRQPTNVVTSTEGKAQMLTIPAGGIVTVVGQPSQETGMVAVMWEGKTLRMFTVDLTRRGEPVKVRAPEIPEIGSNNASSTQ
jgi:hypothetical protein